MSNSYRSLIEGLIYLSSMWPNLAHFQLMNTPFMKDQSDTHFSHIQARGYWCHLLTTSDTSPDSSVRDGIWLQLLFKSLDAGRKKENSSIRLAWNYNDVQSVACFCFGFFVWLFAWASLFSPAAALMVKRIHEWNITKSDRQKQGRPHFTWQKSTCSTPFLSSSITINTMLPVSVLAFRMQHY